MLFFFQCFFHRPLLIGVPARVCVYMCACARLFPLDLKFHFESRAALAVFVRVCMCVQRHFRSLGTQALENVANMRLQEERLNIKPTRQLNLNNNKKRPKSLSLCII